jgi:hypothetical protein
MKRLAVLAGLLSILVVPGVASGAALIPIGDQETWGSEPIFATAPEHDGRLFVVERGTNAGGGAIRVVEGGNVKSQPFLTVPNVDLASERGLLSMAFAPDYFESGLFYVFYTAKGPDALDTDGQTGDIRIVEYRRAAGNPDLADPASARLVLKTPHSAGNHNGGWIGFGPDGKLYIAIGDNADSGNAQPLDNLFGKILRIDPTDPDGTGPETATIPADNPFVNTPGARPEIYTYGLRNPYRASFAPNGDLTIGDVGQGQNEEINAGDLRGKNMGWPECEGFCDTPNPAYTEPVFEYPNAGSSDCAVLGGHVIRDPDLTGLTGRYIYGDLCASDLRTLNLGAPGGDPFPAGLQVFASLRSFGEDSRGCSYVMTAASVLRIAAGPDAGAVCPHEVRPPDPPPPGPTPDTTFTFSIPKKRNLAKRVVVAGGCSIGCGVKVTGVVRVTRNRSMRKPRKFNLRGESARSVGGAKVRLALTLKGRQLRLARKAIRRGSRIVLRVKFTAVADDGSRAAGSGPVRLVRAKRG